MATFGEMLEAVFLVVVNTPVLIVCTLSGGSVMDWLSVWIAGQPAGYISAQPIGYTFGMFYGLIIAVEIALFVHLFVVVLRRTNYTTGEVDF